MSDLSAFTVLFSKFHFRTWAKTTSVSLMQVESKSHEIGHFGSFLNASGNLKGLVVWYVVVSASMEFILFLLANIHVYVVCKLAIKQYCFFLFFCLVCKTSVLPIVITWWVDRWTQYSYCSTVYSWPDIHPSGASSKGIVPRKMRRRWNWHLEKEEEFTMKK